MRIVVNHLTRMHGGTICVAGVDIETLRHVRPVLELGGLPGDLLARYGGPFDMARVLDLGQPRPLPDPPHVEDHVLIVSRARFQRTAAPQEFWELLCRLAQSRLVEIFGGALSALGDRRYGTDSGQGQASLGCLLPHGRPRLYLHPGHDGRQRIRMILSDGQLEADAGVTDLRLYQADHTTPNAELVRGLAQRIEHSDGVVLSLGLTRKFRRSEDSPYFHYLQVNNIHFKEDPTWQLG